MESKFLPFDTNVRLNIIDESDVQGYKGCLLIDTHDDIHDAPKGQHAPHQYDFDVDSTDIVVYQDEECNKPEEEAT